MMPPKYLSRQKPQNIELNLTEIAPTSTKEGRSGKEANIQQENKSTTLRPDVLSYLSNLENKLHSQEVETKNNEDKFPSTIVIFYFFYLCCCKFYYREGIET